MARVDPPLVAGESATLVGFLDYFRETLLLKTQGLDDEQLRHRIEPSTMTLGGMLSHMGYVEDWWFSQVYAAQPPAPPWDTAPWRDDNDWDWHRAADLSGAQLHDEYDRFVARSRDLVGIESDLDRVVPIPGRDPRKDVSLRWIVVHMIEEYARHCGHADLLRETIDGATGD